MAAYYVDNNGTIYASDSLQTTSVAAGASAEVNIGLADLTDFSGLSTWIINRVHFYTKCFIENSGLLQNEQTYLLALGGIAPVGAGTLSGLGDYQGINGWPLKGVHHYLYLQGAEAAGDPGNASMRGVQSFSKTWTPSRRNHLALHREQEINFNVKVVSGNPDVDIFQSIIVEARRGK